MQGTILPVSSFKKINRVAQSQRAEADSRVQLGVHACRALGLPGGGTAPRPQEGPRPGGLSCCVDEGWEGGRFPRRPLPGPSWELPGGRPSRGAAEAQICEVLCTEGGTENTGLCVGGTAQHKESPCLQAKDISQLRFRSPRADSEARTERMSRTPRGRGQVHHSGNKAPQRTAIHSQWPEGGRRPSSQLPGISGAPEAEPGTLAPVLRLLVQGRDGPGHSCLFAAIMSQQQPDERKSPVSIERRTHTSKKSNKKSFP